MGVAGEEHRGQYSRKREGKWGGSHILHDYSGEERFSQAKSLQLAKAGRAPTRPYPVPAEG